MSSGWETGNDDITSFLSSTVYRDSVSHVAFKMETLHKPDTSADRGKVEVEVVLPASGGETAVWQWNLEISLQFRLVCSERQPCGEQRTNTTDKVFSRDTDWWRRRRRGVMATGEKLPSGPRGPNGKLCALSLKMSQELPASVRLVRAGD